MASKNDLNTGIFTRRAFIITGGVTLTAMALRLRLGSVTAEAKPGEPAEVKIIEFSVSGQRGDPVTLPMVVKTDAEWRRQLSAEVYDVTRDAGTERPYSGKYWDLHEKGLYHCICCDTALFNSDTKFDSGTEWPSFWQPVAKENVHEDRDMSFGMERTAVSCRRCDAHLGHVFDDEPQPTGLRYCMNSAALKFAKLA
jgi:peptide-methionine (R)-S-oxide reductase